MIGIIGSKGMLGTEIVNYCNEAGIKYKGYCRKIVNLENFNDLKLILNENKHSIIINTAANIDINLCEKNPKDTEKINTYLPYILSEYCELNNIKFIHISTDHFYIDDGNKKHTEKDPVFIINEYGRQKLNAEYLVLKNKNSAVIRTSIIGYNNKGNSLIDWILNTIKNESQINGFIDSYTSSIDVYSLSKIIVSNASTLKGLINISSSEVYSKYELIKKIIKLTSSNCKLIEESILSLPAKRANSTGLDCDLFEKNYQLSLPDMKDVLNNLKIKEKINEI